MPNTSSSTPFLSSSMSSLRSRRPSACLGGSQGSGLLQSLGTGMVRQLTGSPMGSAIGSPMGSGSPQHPGNGRAAPSPPHVRTILCDCSGAAAPPAQARGVQSSVLHNSQLVCDEETCHANRFSGTWGRAYSQAFSQPVQFFNQKISTSPCLLRRYACKRAIELSDYTLNPTLFSWPRVISVSFYSSFCFLCFCLSVTVWQR